MSQKYLITEKGMEILKKEIEKYKQDFLNLLKTKGEIYVNDGDGWHDNFSFEDLSREEVRIGKLIEDSCQMLMNSELISPSTKSDVAWIGNKITIEDDKGHTMTFIITGLKESDMNHVPKKLEYLSPIANAFSTRK
jgi:hypothetical protein